MMAESSKALEPPDPDEPGDDLFAGAELPRVPRHARYVTREGDTRTLRVSFEDDLTPADRFLQIILMASLTAKWPELHLLPHRDADGQVKPRFYWFYSCPAGQIEQLKIDYFERLVRATYEHEGGTVRELRTPPGPIAWWLVRELRWLSGWDGWRARLGRLLRACASRLDGSPLQTRPGRFVYRLDDECAIELKLRVVSRECGDELLITGFDSRFLPRNAESDEPTG